MSPKQIPIKYFAYCRKSTEDSQRQVASIGDQVNAVQSMVEREGLNLVRPPFTEEKSSKNPGRAIFNEMLERIKDGEANGVICWDIDRLSRNPIDSGQLQWMLQNSVIRVIKTPSREYYPEDAGLLMSIETGRSSDYIIRLSKNVKRGLNSRAMRGWRPTIAPMGYMNVGEKGDKVILKDPERFDLIRQMWDLFLSGTYSVREIRRIAVEDWGFRTRERRKLGGTLPSLSKLYTMFNDPFYYGVFEWYDQETGEKKLFNGNHEPMITEAEFFRGQVLLGKKGKHQPKTREFAFTGLIRCGECASAVTAEEKNQLICSVCKFKFAYERKTACPKCKTDISEMKNPKILNYVYYRCAKRKDPTCSQKTIRLEELEKQFDGQLASLTLDPDYLALALDYLREKQKDAGNVETAQRESLEAAYASCQTRIKNLNNAYTSPQNSRHELYSAEEFGSLKAELIRERDAIEAKMNRTKTDFDQSLVVTERIFNFCTYAREHFNKGNLKQKRAIFSTVGSNLTLKDRKLNIERLHPYLLIENEVKDQRTLLARLEPEKKGYTERKKAALAANIPVMRRWEDSNLR